MQTTTHATPIIDAGTAELVRYVLEDIKALWDESGLGEDEAVSEPLYARLQAAIRILTTQEHTR